MDSDASGYQYTKVWFSSKTPLWSQLFDQIEPVGRVLEIGSFEGRSAVWIIERIASKGPLELHCVDTWAGSREHKHVDMVQVEQRFDRNIALASSGARHPVGFHKHKGRSVDALASLVASHVPPFDFIFVDGSHNAAHVLADAVLSYELLRVGGVLVFDDYQWIEYWRPSEERQIQNEPKLAIDAFQAVFATRFKVIQASTNDQVFLAKER